MITEQLELLGELMYQAHSSYSLCGIGSEGTDTLVELVKESASRAAGLYGAKITGGGSGGSVCILGSRTEQSEEAVRAVAAEYQRRTGLEPYVFSGSSLGADQFGRLIVRFPS